ncbi:MAG: hypothetical protein ACK5OB_08205 [Pirellula sp.]
MKRGLFSFALLALSIVGSTGCGVLHHGEHAGLHGWGARHQACKTCNTPIGCRPCRIGWQRGGTDYGSHLAKAGAPWAGLHGGGHHGAGPISKQAYAADDQVGSGVPGPTVGYPYYTVRGPRDFLMDNPPSIGR